MASNVKWIKMMVGMFDGMSFKKIKRAKIGGESFRDKLTAVWFELMDFAGKCNHEGAFISPSEIPFTDLADIATMIDRDEEELKLCMTFFINEGMVTVIDDIYSLSNWAEYQNAEGMEKIREQNRLRKQRQREKLKLLSDGSRDSHVTVTEGHATEEDIDKEKENKKENKSVRETTRTLFQRLLPDYTFSDLLAEKMAEWITYKTERKEPYKEQGMKSLLRQVENNAMKYGDQAVCNLIEECMANNWKGIIFDKLQSQQKPGSSSYQRQTKADELNDFYNMAENWSES